MVGRIVSKLLGRSFVSAAACTHSATQARLATCRLFSTKDGANISHDADSPANADDDPRPRLYIKTTEDLDEHRHRWIDAAALALDTEFNSFPLYKPKLQLVQIASPDVLACVDCALLPPPVIKDFLAGIADKELIIHSCSTDVQLFMEASGVLPKNVFDTQLAASLLGIGDTIGLANLIAMYNDVTLDKGQTLSDWTKRPLTAEQIDYAIDDVKYLLDIANRLKDQLQTRDRLQWYQEEIARAISKEVVAPETDDYKLWQTTRRIGKLKDNPAARGVLRELCAWREQTARQRNMSPNLICRDELLLSMSMAQPTQIGELANFQGIKPPVIRFHGPAILQAIQKGLANQPYPDMPDTHTSSDEETVKERMTASLLRAISHQVAESTVVAQSLVFPRSELETLSRLVGSKQPIDLDQYTVFQGWRSEVIGKYVLALLDGRLKIGFDHDQVSMTLEIL